MGFLRHRCSRSISSPKVYLPTGKPNLDNRNALKVFSFEEASCRRCLQLGVGHGSERSILDRMIKDAKAINQSLRHERGMKSRGGGSACDSCSVLLVFARSSLDRQVLFLAMLGQYFEKVGTCVPILLNPQWGLRGQLGSCRGRRKVSPITHTTYQ